MEMLLLIAFLAKNNCFIIWFSSSLFQIWNFR